MKLSRRELVKQAAGIALAAGLSPRRAPALEETKPLPIIDTHQHLWNPDKFKLLWFGAAPDILKRTYTNDDYHAATEGLDILKAVYMEVDVDPSQHVTEAEDLIAICKSGTAPTVAAVIGGRPASPDFEGYLDRFRDNPAIKGVRQVLHEDSVKPGFCLEPDFVRGIRLLGARGLSYDLCMRPAELGDALKLTELCPDTRFIVDHCGNADPKAFRKGEASPSHDPVAWKQAIDKLAGQKNVIGKISGIVARAPKGWTADDLAPVVNHCLDAFGPDRVVFGGDWPVCLIGATYRQWVEALRSIVANRPVDAQRKLWSENAERFYSLT